MIENFRLMISDLAVVVSTKIKLILAQPCLAYENTCNWANGKRLKISNAVQKK
jgi:hypothetical protein